MITAHLAACSSIVLRVLSDIYLLECKCGNSYACLPQHCRSSPWFIPFSFDISSLFGCVQRKKLWSGLPKPAGKTAQRVRYRSAFADSSCVLRASPRPTADASCSPQLFSAKFKALRSPVQRLLYDQLQISSIVKPCACLRRAFIDPDLLE